MKQLITKMLLILIIGAMTLGDAFSQCATTVMPNNGSTSGNGRAPNARFRTGRGVYLVTAAEMAAAGMFNGQVITGIGWLNSTLPGLAATGTLTVYLQNTSDLSNLKSTTWATAIGGMTVASNAAYTIPNSLSYTVTFSGGSTFTYTGGGVYVAFDWAYCVGTLSVAQVISCNNGLVGGGNGLLSLQSTLACTTGTALAGSSFRPDTRFFAACINNDARVTNIYTTGSLPNTYTTGHVIQAVITNPGLNTLTNLAVTLSITGANSFSNVQTIASIASGGTATVTFAGFTPSAIGNNTVTVSVPADDNNSNNTQTMTQEITSDYFSYRYPGTVNSGGVGFNGGTGQFCGKFNTALPSFVQEVQVDFTTSGLPYRMAIYGDNAGVPGTLLYEDATNRTTAVGTAFLTLGTNVTIPAGNFYVSIEQQGTTNVGFAYTTESPMRSGGFFYTSLPAGVWTDLGPGNLPFRFNIRVNLHLPVPPNCATSFSPANLSTGNCLNSVLSWVSGGGAPTGYLLTFGTNSPNYDNVLNNVDLGNVLSYNPGILSPGTTYGYKVVPYNADGNATGCSMNTFTTVTSGALPFTEDFSGITFPPTCWSRSDNTYILRNNASTSGTGSAEFDFFNAPVGNYDLTSPIFGNTPAGEVLSFNYAYATFATENDQLEIFYSTNQGGSFTSLELLNGGPTGILNTGGTSAAEFVPTTAQWGLHQVVLPTGTNMLRFRGISAFGNDLYIDNINVDAPPALPNCPINHSPANLATGVFRDGSITWANGGGASFFDVFFDLGAGPATTLVSANQAGTSYTPPTMAANQQYSWRVVAKNISGSAIGCSDMTFTTGAIFDYCNPLHSPGCGNGNITNVTFNTLNNTTTCNPPASQNFPASGSTTTSVNKGSSYNLSVTCDQSCIISVWIDWNHDGSFDASEWTQVATASTANVADVISIAVPISAQPGLTGMRIRSRFALNINGAGDACTVMGSGEAEDYYITVNCGGTISSNSPICSNTTLNLFSGPTGATFSWSGPSFTSGVQNPSIPNALVGTNDGTYSVNVTSTGCNENLNTNVVINALPSVAPTASGPFCEGTANLNLAANAPTATGWSWSGPGTITNGNTANASVLSAPASASGSYSVTVTDANSCSNTASVSATVWALPPVAVTVIGSNNLCTGQTTSDLQATGAVNYLWTTTETSSLITVSTQGTYTVTGTDGNGCVNTDAAVITESAPPAIPVISPAGPVVLCTDGFTTTSVNLSVTNYATDLLWSTSETDQTITINYADIFNVTYTDGNGCYSVSNPVTVTVDNYSTAPTSATSNAPFNNICLGNTVTLNMVGGTLGDNAQWKWYEGGCGTGASIASGPNPTITPLTVGPHTYYVRSESVSCGNTGCASITITVSPATALATVHYTASTAVGCNGSSATFSVNAVPGAAFYNWSGTSGALFNGVPGPVQTASNSVTVTFATPPPAGASGYNICCFAGNACASSNTICTWVRAKVSQPSAISGGLIACPSTSSGYSVAPVLGADTYTWTITGNANINGGGATLTTASPSITVNFLAGWSSGTLSVYASMNCGFNSATRNLSISNTPAIPGTMSGPGLVCPSASSSFSVSAVPGAASYNWTTNVPGAVVSPSGNTASIAFPAVIPAGSQVCVTSISSCGAASPQRCKSVANGIPNIPGNISGPSTGQCGQSGVSYSITPVAGASSYLWSTSSTQAVISGPNNLSSASVNFTSSYSTVTLSVTANNSCGSSLARTLAVSGFPGLPAAITGNAAPCAGMVEAYSTAGASGATSYNWTVPAGSSVIGGQGSANASVLIGNTAGLIGVTASNDCGVSGTRTFAITIPCRQGQVEASIGSAIASLYPNPTSGKTTVKFESVNAAKYVISVVDITGRIIISDEMTSTEGINMHELDLTKVSRGIYVVRLETAGEQTQLIKVTVQ